VTQQADDARKRGDFAGAYDILAPQLQAQRDDPALLTSMAGVYLSAKRPREAKQLYVAALQRDPRNADAYSGAIGAAIDAKDYLEAGELAKRALQLAPQNPRFHYLAAQVARATDDNKTAVEHLQAAQALQRRQARDAGGGAAPDLPPNPFRAGGAPAVASAKGAAGIPAGSQVAALDPSAAYATPAAGFAAGAPARDTLSQDIDRSLQEIRRETAPALVPSVGVRTRSGEQGLGKLTDIEAPTAVTVSPGYKGKLTASLTPVHLDSGTLSTSADVRRRFGSGYFNPPGVESNHQASGVGVGLGYTLKGFDIDAGTTPLGFPTTRPQGAIGYTTSVFNPNTTLKAQAMRRPVTESLLSYAGQKDPASGQLFGAVMRTGGRLELANDDGYFGSYVNAAYNVYDGENVASNTSYEGGLGAFIRPYRGETDALKVGVNLTYLAFEKNLGKYTLGHGGYFSPQDYVSLSLPVEYTGKFGPYSVTVGGALGVQSYDEKQAPYFPTNSALQARLQTVAATDPTVQAFYPSRSSSGISANLHGDVSYELTPDLSIGGSFTYDSFGNYSEQAARVYLRRTFGGN
jgi:cellulose synthase operon protein C